jgi:hypothetical protein
MQHFCQENVDSSFSHLGSIQLLRTIRFEGCSLPNFTLTEEKDKV